MFLVSHLTSCADSWTGCCLQQGRSQTQTRGSCATRADLKEANRSLKTFFSFYRRIFSRFPRRGKGKTNRSLLCRKSKIINKNNYRFKLKILVHVLQIRPSDFHLPFVLGIATFESSESNSWRRKCYNFPDSDNFWGEFGNLKKLKYL